MSGMVAVDVADAQQAEPPDHAAVESGALVPVEPDAVEWCRTLWRSMADRLRRQAREHERQADHFDRIAVGLSLWAIREFPWAHTARTTARLDALTSRTAASICRDGAHFARGALAELSAPEEATSSATSCWDDDGGAQPAPGPAPFYVEPELLERANSVPERDGVWTLGPRLPFEGINEIRIADVSRMAVRRSDLGFPPIFELADPDYAGTRRERSLRNASLRRSSISAVGQRVAAR